VEQEGFYRVELGDVEVTALSDGTTPLYDAPCGAGFHGDVIAHEDRYEKIASPPDRGDQFRVELPGSYTADQIVDNQPSGAHPLTSIMERCGVI